MGDGDNGLEVYNLNGITQATDLNLINKENTAVLQRLYPGQVYDCARRGRVEHAEIN